MTFAKSLLYIVTAGIFFSTCTKDKGRPVPLPNSKPADTLIAAENCTTNIKYSAHISKIVAASCAIEGCHVASGYKDFSTYQALKSVIDQRGKAFFISVIQPGGGMPPSYTTGDTLSLCDIQKMEVWLNEGYQDN